MPEEASQLMQWIEWALYGSGSVVLAALAVVRMRRRDVFLPRLGALAASVEFFLCLMLSWVAAFLLSSALYPVLAAGVDAKSKLGGMWATACGTLGLPLGLLAGLGVFWLATEPGRADHGMSPRRLGLPALAGLSVVLFLATQPVLTAASTLYGWLDPRGGTQEVVNTVRDGLHGGEGFVPASIVAAAAIFLAPLAEELVFRAGLHRLFRNWMGPVGAALAGGVAFGLVHMAPAQFLPLAALGFMLSLAYEYSGDLRLPILAHALFNASTVAALYFIPDVTKS